jgi:hypothetical protein
VSLQFAAVALLTGAAAACGQTSAKPAPAAPAADVKAPARPPSFTKHFYHAPSGTFYVPAGVPIRMSIGLAAGGGSGSNSADRSSVTLKEGPNTLQFGVARVPVIADGTPPSTTLSYAADPHVESNGHLILGPHPHLHMTATDALSGVARTLVSLDGAPFEPLPPGGPAFTKSGDHLLRYFSVDHVGNVEPMQRFAFRLDKTPPVASLHIAGPRAASVVGSGAVFTLTAQDADAGVQVIHFSIDGGAQQAWTKPLQIDALSEGRHSMQSSAVDRVENAEKPQTFAFTVDRTPPQISLAIHGPEYTSTGVRYIAPQATISLSARDAVAGTVPVLYSVDNGPQQTYAAPFHLPSTSGIHHLRLQAKDSVGNLKQVYVDDIYVDRTAPDTDIQFSRPFYTRKGATVLNPDSKIQLDPSDFESGVATVTYSLDGGAAQPYTAPFSVTALGDHRLTFSAVDHVGNREAPQTVLLNIEPRNAAEALPPVLDAKRWYLDPKLGLMGPPGLPFELRISDSPDPHAQSFLISPEAAPTPKAAAAPGSKSDPNSGPLTFVRTGHNVMKVGITHRMGAFGIAIDGAPPRTTMKASGARRVEVAGTTYFGPGLTIALTSADDPVGTSSGLWKTLESLNGSAFARYTGPLSIFSHDGSYTLRYYALDNVGNAEKVHTFAFTVDTTPPRTRLELRGPHQADTLSPKTQIALVASDNLSGVALVTCQLDNGGMHSCRQPFAVGRIGDGPHRLRYYSVDAVGNREQVHDWSFTLISDVNAPTFSVRGSSVQRGATIYATPGSTLVFKTDEGDTVMYSLDSQAPQAYSKPLPIPQTGNHRLAWHAVDALGNVSSTHSIGLVPDRAAPSSQVRFTGPQTMHNAIPLIGAATKIALYGQAGPVGVASIEYRLGGGHWLPYKDPFSIRNSGTFDLEWRARNDLGTLQPVQRQRVMVDALGPVIDVTWSAQPVDLGGVLHIQPGMLLFLSAQDQPAGLQELTYGIDGQPQRIYRAPLSGFAPGTSHTVTVVAEDLVGNRSQRTIKIQVDNKSQEDKAR